MEFSDTYLSSSVLKNKYGGFNVYVDGEEIEHVHGIDPIEGLVTAYACNGQGGSSVGFKDFILDNWPCYVRVAQHRIHIKPFETGKITEIYKREVDNTES